MKYKYTDERICSPTFTSFKSSSSAINSLPVNKVHCSYNPTMNKTLPRNSRLFNQRPGFNGILINRVVDSNDSLVPIFHFDAVRSTKRETRSYFSPAGYLFQPLGTGAIMKPNLHRKTGARYCPFVTAARFSRAKTRLRIPGD